MIWKLSDKSHNILLDVLSFDYNNVCVIPVPIALSDITAVVKQNVTQKITQWLHPEKRGLFSGGSWLSSKLYSVLSRETDNVRVKVTQK